MSGTPGTPAVGMPLLSTGLTPGGTPASGMSNQMQQTALLRATAAPAAPTSIAGASASSSGVALSADAPAQARMSISTILDGTAQSKISLQRIQNELDAVLFEISNAFTGQPNHDVASRITNVLTSLNELQRELARTGLGALPLLDTPVIDPVYYSTMIAATQLDVQTRFKSRHVIRENGGIAKASLR